ncbi:hypothetical protein [Obesumbacterium proteus]|uniref:hypothetical protein n=1 Tax=Obesumbacterium proteus TaxID=82983 RepID=UPI00242B658F|nr:hypothetical protein [Obesumbacterium proteus]
MTSNRNCHYPLQQNSALIFCLLAAFLPLGSTLGVIFSWCIFPIFSIIITMLYSRRFQLRGVLFFFFAIIILISNYFIVVQYVDFNKKLEFNLFLAIIGCFYVSISLFSVRLNFPSLIKAIDKVLFVNLVLFFIQFIAYYALHFKIDYSLMTGGIGTRNDYGSIFRASGIFNEPAEYSSAMAVLVTIRYLISSKIKKLHYISLLTMLLSFSFVGVFQAVAIFFIVNFGKIKRNPIYIFPIAIVLCVVFFAFHDLFIQRYDAFMLGNDGSNNTKIDTLNFFINNPDYLYGGAGLIGYDPETMPLFMQGLYDVTFFGSCITVFGVYIGGLLSLIMIIFLLLHYKKSEILIILVCLAKINVMIYASYWFFIIAIFIIPKLRKDI